MGVVNGWKVAGKWKLRNNVQEFAIEKRQKGRSQTEKKGDDSSLEYTCAVI